jgi:hypothetical protein
MITEALVWALMTLKEPKEILATHQSQAMGLEDAIALDRQHFGQQVRCVLRYSVIRSGTGRLIPLGCGGMQHESHSLDRSAP